MLYVAVAFGTLVSLVAAQQINFMPVPGTRSLWIPFKTISGVPFASVLGHDRNNHTTYVLSCPTGQPQCALAPNLTLTEGTDFARWESSTSGATSGTVELNCPSLTAAPVTCFQNAHGGGNVAKTQAPVPQSEIVYQVVNVTALAKDKDKHKTKHHGKATKHDTKTATPTPTTTSTSSAWGVQTVAAGPFMIGGAMGAGVLALAAL